MALAPLAEFAFNPTWPTSVQLAASYKVTSGASNTNALVTASFTPAAGEVIVVKGSADRGDQGAFPTPTGGSLTYTQQQQTVPTASHNRAGLWTAVVGTSPGSMTVSLGSPGTAATFHTMVVERWQNAQLAGTPASVLTEGTGTAPSTTVTTAAANSVVTWLDSDWMALDGAARAYNTTSAVPTEVAYQFNPPAGTSETSYYAYQQAATSGSQTFGLTAPGGQNWTLIGVEVQYLAAAGGNANAQAAANIWTAADAQAALDLAADSASVPLVGADAQASVAPAAGSGSVPLAAADAQASVAVNAGSATITVAAADATVSTATSTNADAQSAAITFTAADAQASVAVNAGSAVITVETVTASSVDVTVDAQSATVPFAAADASVQTTGTTNANAQSASVPFVAADAAVALTVDAGAASVPVAAADATAGVGPAAGAASLPVAAQDAAAAIDVNAGSATVGLAAADATVSTLAFTNADAQSATVTFTAVDAQASVAPTAAAAAVPFTAADATAVNAVDVQAQPAAITVAAADASASVVVNAGAATIPLVVGAAGWGVGAGSATVAVNAADASVALTVNADPAVVPLAAADATIFIPPPVPPPRWVEHDSDATGIVEGALVGAGIVEGSSSL